MMKSWLFFIRILISILFISVIGVALFYQVTQRLPFTMQVNSSLQVLTHKTSFIILLAAFALYLAIQIFEGLFSKVLFHGVHRKTKRIESVQERSIEELHNLREGWTTFIQLAASSNEGAPPDWKACLYEIKRVLDDMLIQIHRDQRSPNMTLVTHIQVQIEYLERQIEAWLTLESQNTPVKKALEPLPDEVNKALSYIDQLLAEKSDQLSEEPMEETLLPPRRERGKLKKAKRPVSKKKKKSKTEPAKVPLPPRKVVHVPWWRKIGKK